MDADKKVPDIQPNQIVSYKGNILRVSKILPDGRVEACHATMRVTGYVWEFEVFE